MKWWRHRRGRKKVRYPRVRFGPVGDTLVPREWAAEGEAGPLSWSASLRRVPEGVHWALDVGGTLTGHERREGLSANPYAAGDECKAALRAVIDEHNAFSDVAGG